MISPTGSWEIRHDSMGSGSFDAPRGNRRHNGVDLVVAPGSDILMPINGTIVREAYPYAGDLKWSGCLLGTEDLQIKMFYMRLSHSIRQNIKKLGGHWAHQGDVIGKAQNISNKHGKDMIPHIHLEIKKMDWMLINPEEVINDTV